MFLAHLSTMCSSLEALRWYCIHRTPCLVRRASSTISFNIFSSQITGSVCTKLGRNVPLDVLFEKKIIKLDSTKNYGCHGNQLEFFKQFLKNHLLWNPWLDFEIISQEYDPFQNLFAKF